MIPSFIDEEAPSGEKDVWHLLAAGPADWTVMHSLDLAPWRRNSRTEVDFVVIVPDTGLLCIEVKSQSEIEFRPEGWHPHKLGKGPFKQCQDAVKSLYRRLCDIAQYAATIPMVGLCVFPNAPFDRSCLSVADWELMDGPEFRSHSSAHSFCAALQTRMQRALEEERFAALSLPLAPARVDNIVELCLPIRKRVPERRAEMSAREKQLEKTLRNPQRTTLQLCEDNDRVLVSGGAGTGKTLIAMELALRVAQQYDRVALVCFNQLVGEWMKARIQSQRPGPTLIVDRAVRLLAGLTEIGIPSGASDRFWNEDLPEQVQERLTDPTISTDAAFDYLIVDEAQDLLGRPWIWESLMLLLKGGLVDGHFALFGDVEGQTLGAASFTQSSLEALTRLAKPTRWRLTENCRNYDVVGRAAVALSGMPLNTYSAYLREGGSFRNLEYVPFRDDRDQATLVKSTLHKVRASGFRDSEVTLLSFCASDRSVARALVAEGLRIAPAGTLEPVLTYTSVHSFKGMENKVVIVTDLDLQAGAMSRALFYTALTRATESVFIMCRSEDTQQLLAWSR